MPLMEYTILIHKRLTDQISVEEERQLELWINASAQNKNEYNEICQIWQGSLADDEETISEEELKIEFKKLESAVLASVEKEALLKSKNSKKIIKNSAIVLLIISSTLLFAWNLLRTPVHFSSKTMALSKRGITELMLSDSSKIILNDSAVITINENDMRKEISVEGEVLFQLKKSNLPIVVKANGISVTVSETSFLIKSYSNRQQEVVALEGAIEVVINDEKVMLQQGDKLVTSADHSMHYENINDNLNSTAWYTRKLSFQGASLETVAKELEHHYHIHVSLSNNRLSACRFTGIFDHTSLDNVLKVLSYSLDIDIISVGPNSYLVTGKGCTS